MKIKNNNRELILPSFIQLFSLMLGGRDCDDFIAIYVNDIRIQYLCLKAWIRLNEVAKGETGERAKRRSSNNEISA